MNINGHAGENMEGGMHTVWFIRDNLSTLVNISIKDKRKYNHGHGTSFQLLGVSYISYRVNAEEEEECPN